VPPGAVVAAGGRSVGGDRRCSRQPGRPRLCRLITSSVAWLSATDEIMFEITSFGDVDDRIRQVSEVLFDGISAAMSGKPWTFAFIDMRWTTRSATGVLKPRVVLPNGTIRALLDTPIENVSSKVDFLLKADFILDEVWKSQGNKGTKKWYGIRLTFKPAGESELGLDYDPECGVDPTFCGD
jgi:hypothetical protein